MPWYAIAIEDHREVGRSDLESRWEDASYHAYRLREQHPDATVTIRETLRRWAHLGGARV